MVMDFHTKSCANHNSTNIIYKSRFIGFKKRQQEKHVKIFIILKYKYHLAFFIRNNINKIQITMMPKKSLRLHSLKLMFKYDVNIIYN